MAGVYISYSREDAAVERTVADALSSADHSALTTFDEWRGGCGLSLAIARRVIESHGGRIWSPAVEPNAGAVAILPVP